ncbi:PREDICTED: S phase cyclin A-associated protein in the endoplasmic reticulum-like [Habropoda laboriosa]|uniref:S phase cyclin A-associated protein in the endoplasmic reticulum-like n=1 Tax=Habropoda laboriosa TaxID=597456 RepID=UPI00083DE772|nr:PREDICTED: S phase cyclin A-associated protein in the endoplasmic reticulum-like [Habropoda laboriosa]
MDFDVEKIHNILTEANLPSCRSLLKNPTEDYVFSLIITFLQRFSIKVGRIDKPTMEQQDIMQYCEDTDIIRVINLHIAMVQICDRIYLKDFGVTDILSPSSKRIRRQAKFLANFILYANNKELDIKDKVCHIQHRAKVLHDILEKKNETLEAINDKALYIAKKLSSKEKLIFEIQKFQSKIEENNKYSVELMAKMTAAEEKKQQALELYRTYKAQVVKLSKTTAELQSEVVKTPEEYQMRLNELEQQQNVKVKERETMQEAFQDKKHSIEQQKNILAVIQNQLDKLNEMRDIYDQLKKIRMQEDSVGKKIDIFKTHIAEIEKKLVTQNDQYNKNEVNEIHIQYEECLSQLRNLSAQLLSKKKLYKEKLEKAQIQRNEDYLNLKKMNNMIKKLEDETAVLITNYQDLYNNEISTA